MEQALGPRGLSTPDVIKSALNKNEAAGAKINTNAIDNLFGAPDKIVIPERYVPDVVSITVLQIFNFWPFEFEKHSVVVEIA